MQLHKALFFVSLKLQLTDIMLKKLLISLLVLVLFPSFLMAQQDFRRHEFRLGMGDMGFEKAAFHNSRQQVGYRYFGHLFAGYRYSFNDWLGAGADVDSFCGRVSPIISTHTAARATTPMAMR